MKALFKLQFLYILAIAFPSISSLSSCSQEEDVAVGSPSEVSFSINKQTADEGTGTLKINIQLDKPQNVRTVLNYRVEGNAISSLKSTLQADYEIITESPLIIPKGETSTSIELKILEDEDFEPELENIILKLDAVLEGNAVLSDDISKRAHTLAIQENDYQLFLEWENPEDRDVDMKVYVELPNRGLLASEHSSGLEKVTVTNARENEQYYVDVWLSESDSEVNYSLKFMKAGNQLKETLVDDHFKSASTQIQEENRAASLKNFLLVRAGLGLKIL